MLTDLQNSKRYREWLRGVLKPKYCRHCGKKKVIANFSSKMARKCNACKIDDFFRKKYDAAIIASRMFKNAEMRCDPAYCRIYTSYSRKRISVRMTLQDFRHWAIPVIREFMRTMRAGRASIELMTTATTNLGIYKSFQEPRIQENTVQIRQIPRWLQGSRRITGQGNLPGKTLRLFTTVVGQPFHES